MDIIIIAMWKHAWGNKEINDCIKVVDCRKMLLFSFSSYFNSQDYVTFITKLCNKDICDFQSKSIYIMGDKVTVWLIIVIQSLKDKMLTMEINTDWKNVESLLSLTN